ncbi:hypothetical protein HYC85_006287 [Camellia sinensis]|uniref:3-hydroxyacyl-CoA dehydrogenase NAD binding domain-containing protein n=1 Tax=Camellia sinensis TaxID=4442 RepID=A0A7J7HMH5_CAMSI|nr:hypothetical protein HYC85_006287 [Camellia sinensis]
MAAACACVNFQPFPTIVCINVAEEGIVSGPRVGLWKEVEAFQGLLHSDTCKSLIHIFFSQRGTSRVPGITDRGLVPRRISKVAILGGGLMGSGIATSLILSNYPVVLKEVNDNFLQTGVGRVRGINQLYKLPILCVPDSALDESGSGLDAQLDYPRIEVPATRSTSFKEKKRTLPVPLNQSRWCSAQTFRCRSCFSAARSLPLL